jgi:hypothetical protein
MSIKKQLDMKKINKIYLLLTTLVALTGIVAKAQSPVFNDYNNLYINQTPFKDLRVHNNTNIGIVVMAPINIELPKFLTDSTMYPTDPEDINRLPEGGFPGVRFFKGNRTMTFSFIYARKAYKFDGTGTTALGSQYSSYLEKQSKSRIALRFAYDWHFKPNRFKWFDLDHYCGYSANIGVAPTKNIRETTSLNNSVNNSKVTSNPLTVGGDVYWGLNLKREYYSLGAEFLVFGFDLQKNVGRDKVETETTIGGSTTSSSYYTNDYFGSQPWESIKSASSQVTMFKGFRLVAIIYLNNPNKNN